MELSPNVAATTHQRARVVLPCAIIWFALTISVSVAFGLTYVFTGRNDDSNTVSRSFTGRNDGSNGVSGSFRSPPPPFLVDCSECGFTGPTIDMSNSSQHICTLNVESAHGDSEDCGRNVGALLFNPSEFFFRSRILDTARNNTHLLNCAIHTLREYQTTTQTPVHLSIGKGLHVMAGGINLNNVSNFNLTIEGCLDFGACLSANSEDCIISKKDYGMMANFSNSVTTLGFSNDLKPAISVCGVSNFSWTGGTILGGGAQWYGPANIGILGDNRGKTKPILIDGVERCPQWGNNVKTRSENVKMHHFTLLFSPYWNTYLELENSEIGNCKILSQHAQSIIFQNEAQDSSTFDTLLEEVFSFNTDGLDIGGDNNYVHDCDIRVGDDIVAIKGFNGQQSSNIRVENIIGSGFGLTIGSEGSAKNILFQNCSLNDTARAIYVKTRVENVVYKDITAGRSFLFPIWVGPPYQGIFNNGNCELTWPFAPPLISNLTTPPSFLCGGSVTVNNLTLVNVNIIESLTSPFISLGTIGNIHLENVNLPDNLLPSPFFEITNNGTFALDARPTCRFEPHGTTITATNSSHSFENCTRGGYLFEKAGVSNGVSYCPGRTYPQYSTSNEKFGVCQS